MQSTEDALSLLAGTSTPGATYVRRAAEARWRLNGGVAQVLLKAAYARDEMLAEPEGITAGYLPERPRP